MKTDPVELMNLAARIARAAGDIVIRGRRSGRLDSSTKSTATDMVTKWDGLSEHMIVDAIRSARPGDGIVGEEGTEIASSSGISWLIDPIDGTTNFMYGLSGYAVSIAATDESGAIAGVVFLPTTRELFVAARGHGSWLGERRLECTTQSDPSTALVGTGFSYSSTLRQRQGARIARLLPNVRDIRRLGAAAPDLCFMADGRLDAYFEENLSPWDMAAGLLVATEAGAIASDFTGGPPRPAEILVSAPGLHSHLIAFLTP